MSATSSVVRRISSYIFILSASVLLVLTSTAPVFAGLLSINTTMLSSNGAELSSLGNTLHAWNVFGNEVATPTTNGITWSDTQPAQISLTGFNPGASVVDNPYNILHYDNQMDEVMEDFLVTNFTADGLLTVGGLTPGSMYQIQVLSHHDVLNESGRLMEVHFGNSAAGPGGGVYSAGSIQGFISTILFSADSSSQTVFLESVGSSRFILNGVVVTSVPAPELYCERISTSIR